MPDTVKAARKLMTERVAELKEFSAIQKSFGLELAQLGQKILDCNSEEQFRLHEKHLSTMQNRIRNEAWLEQSLLFPDRILGRDGHSILAEHEEVNANNTLASSESKEHHENNGGDDDDDVPIAQQIKMIKQLKSTDATEASSPKSPTSQADGKETKNLIIPICHNCSKYLDGSDSASLVSPSESLQHRNWKKSIMLLWSDISSYRCASIFQGPVKAEDAPKYYEIIRAPMDLSSIKQRIRDNVSPLYFPLTPFHVKSLFVGN